MKTLKELRARWQEVSDGTKAIVAKAKDEGREWTEDETAAVEAATQELESIKTEMAEVQAALNRQAELAAQFDAQTAAGTNRRATTNDHEHHFQGPYQPGRVQGGGLASEHDAARGFKHLGEFAAAVQTAMTPGGFAEERLAPLHAAASGLSQGVGPEGGYLVPPSYSTAIWDGMNRVPDNLLAKTDNYTVEGESLTFNANAETSRATGSRYGGVRGYWLSEAAQMTASKPKWRQLKLEPHQLGVFVYVTDKLLRNSPVALEQYLQRAATEEIAFLVSDAIYEGTGAGQPLGMINSGCKVEVSKETGQSAATIVAENIIKMWARMHARSRANAAWYINQDCEPQLSVMNIPVGTGGQLIYMPPGGLSGSQYATLFGRPVVPLEYCATLGTAGDIVLCDFGMYASGTRGSVESALSIHLRFDYNETAFRFLFEADGQSWLKSPITPFKGSNTQSCCVTLATRA